MFLTTIFDSLVFRYFFLINFNLEELYWGRNTSIGSVNKIIKAILTFGILPVTFKHNNDDIWQVINTKNITLSYKPFSHISWFLLSLKVVSWSTQDLYTIY